MNSPRMYKYRDSYVLYIPKVHTFCSVLLTHTLLVIENSIYIREEFKESLGMNFFSPFQPEREFKVYKSCKCSQIMCSRLH